MVESSDIRVTAWSRLPYFSPFFFFGTLSWTSGSEMDLTRKLEDDSRAHNDERNVSIDLDLTNVPGTFEFPQLILVSSSIQTY